MVAEVIETPSLQPADESGPPVLGALARREPLMVTMAVAVFAVHWGNGWAAIADSSSQEVAVRLGAARDILREHGNYSWLTEKGNFVILNNGIEFGVTYFAMCLALLFTGGGRYTSVDYYLSRLFPPKS